MRNNRLFKHFALTLLAVIVLGAATTSTAHADSSDPIWRGLWAGSNLNFGSSASGSSTAAASPQPTRKVYAALGDSVAAGLGLTTPPNATDLTRQCGRSLEAYPRIVAQQMNYRIKHIACSGATAGDLYTRQAVSGPNIIPQLDRAYSGNAPNVISITAGANDAHWAEFLNACYAFDCSTTAYTLAANAWLVKVQANLHASMASIYLRSGGAPPKVLLTGYYNPVSPTCTTLQNKVTAGEIRWMTAETNAINQTIRNVASSYSFVTYVPVDFTGHDVCSANSWIQGVADPAPFHPTAAGQKAIARSVLSTLGR